MPMSPRLLRPRASGLVLPSDADARAYVLAVNTADGQPLEAPVVQAIDAFVIGCKADGIWSAIKDCCLLAGARTLTGALVPMKGASPTSNAFLAADYARGGTTPGLKGNGSTKYLDANNLATAYSQNDCHVSVYATEVGTLATTQQYIGSSTLGLLSAGNSKLRARVFFNAGDSTGNLRAVGLMGGSRSASGSYIARGAGANETISGTSSAASSVQLPVFARRQAPVEGVDIASDGRLAWYSLGSNVDLALLDSRLTTLIDAIRVAV